MTLVDPHVHLRDWNQAAKETIRHGFTVATAAGISGLFEMPNTDPTLTNRERVEKRIAEADVVRRELGLSLYHGLYLGLTDDIEQVRSAVAIWRDLFPRVVGCKLYAGHSTGRMGVTATGSQFAVWKALAQSGYTGVVAVHAEREDMLRPGLASLSDPVSHTEARPAMAEITSVQTQITLAEAAGFRGTLHICHVSCPETVEIIEAERDALPFRLTGATTPHHLLLDTAEVALRAGTAEGIPLAEYNVNPPLRSPVRRLTLLDHLLRGAVDWVESDHAPHTLAEKSNGASGLPGLAAFRLLVDALAARLPQHRVRRLAGEAAIEAFGIDPKLIPDSDHTLWPDGVDERRAVWAPLATEYPWDPYRGVVERSDIFSSEIGD